MNTALRQDAPTAGHFDVLEHGFKLLGEDEAVNHVTGVGYDTWTRSCRLRAGWGLLLFVGFLQGEHLWEWFS